MMLGERSVKQYFQGPSYAQGNNFVGLIYGVFFGFTCGLAHGVGPYVVRDGRGSLGFGN